MRTNKLHQLFHKHLIPNNTRNSYLEIPRKIRLEVAVEMIMAHHNLDKREPHPGLCLLYNEVIVSLVKKTPFYRTKRIEYLVQLFCKPFYNLNSDMTRADYKEAMGITESMRPYWWERFDFTAREIVIKDIIASIQSE